MILLSLAGFLVELLNSSLGMLYGTILSPLLIIGGYDPLVVVPSILLTQAISGLVAAIGHHRLRHADFSVDAGAIQRREGVSYITGCPKRVSKEGIVGN